MWFQNLPLNLCDQKRKSSVLFRLFFPPRILMEETVWYSASTETGCDVRLEKEYALAIHFNTKYLTSLFPVGFVPFLHICVLLFYDLGVFHVLPFFFFSYFISLHRVSEFVLSCTGTKLCYLYQQSPTTNLSCQTIFTVHTVFFRSKILILSFKKTLIFLINFFIEGLMHVHYRNCSSSLKIDYKEISLWGSIFIVPQ